MRAFKFRLYPDKEQRLLLEKTFGCVRFIYNKMLSDKIAYYELNKRSLNTTPAAYKKEYEWLKEVDSLALCNAQLHLDTAFRNFFRDKGRTGFPSFKAKHRGSFSYTTNKIGKNITVSSRSIRLPKLGNIKAVIHRDPPDTEDLKSVTVSRTPSGKYFAALLYDIAVCSETKVPDNAIGLDFSMNKLYVASDGTSAEYPQFYRKAEQRLAKHQRVLSRRQKGSKRYSLQKRKVAVLHEKVANQRKDFLHKLSSLITKSYDLICLEDLNMKDMSRSLNFGKAVHDDGFGMFRTFLIYKADGTGSSVVLVDKWYPSSKTCSMCGRIRKTLELSERTFRCECGHTEGRDPNAAKNIRREGIRIYKAAGHAVSAQLCCDPEITRLRSPRLKALA